MEQNDLMGKLQSVLNDEESMKQIRELADMLMGSEGKQQSPPQLSNTVGEGTAPAGMPNGIDIAKLMQLGQMLQTSSAGDKNIALLLALKPLLKEENRPKIDRAVKILRLLDLYPILKQSGLSGGDLFGLL